MTRAGAARKCEHRVAPPPTPTGVAALIDRCTDGVRARTRTEEKRQRLRAKRQRKRKRQQQKRKEVAKPAVVPATATATAASSMPAAPTPSPVAEREEDNEEEDEFEEESFRPSSSSLFSILNPGRLIGSAVTTVRRLVSAAAPLRKSCAHGSAFISSCALSIGSLTLRTCPRRARR